MRWTFVIALLLASVSFGQVSPEEAAKRLAEKQAARQAERSKMVSITQGELDDMKAEIARLKNELAQLKASSQPASTVAAAKMPTGIVVGITKAELQRFVTVKKTQYSITSDTPAPGDPTRENMEIAVKAKRKVYSGIGTNGVNRVSDYHEEMRPDSTLAVVLLNGTVSSVNETKLPLQRDERDPLGR